jgi:inner membrane protein
MDTLTHALSGALLARATWCKGHQLSLRHRTQVGFITAAFPDIDYLLRLTTDNFLVYLNYHRGITHSVLMLPLWALILSLILSRLLKPSPDWRSLYIICCLGLGIHIAGDVITSYGTMIFAPFSDWRTSLDTTFIIDPFFTGIIVISLICSLMFKQRQVIAMSGLVVLIAYISMQAWAHHRSIQIGHEASQKHGWRNTTVNALPQPLSPFHWKIIVEHKEHYHIALVRLLGEGYSASNGDGFFAHLFAAYHPPSIANWVREDRYGYDRYEAKQIKFAWQDDVIKDFRRFARFPVLINDTTLSERCHWFTDLRFIIPGRENTRLFTYGLCSTADPDALFLQATH